MQATPLGGYVGDVIEEDYQFECMRLQSAMEKFVQVTGEKWRPRFTVDTRQGARTFTIGSRGEWNRMQHEERHQIWQDIAQLPNIPVKTIHYVGPLTRKCNLVSVFFYFCKFFFFGSLK